MSFLVVVTAGLHLQLSGWINPDVDILGKAVDDSKAL